MKNILCADFGSTYTKLAAINVSERKILAVAKAFTTVSTNVMEGFDAALADIRAQCGDISFDDMRASSSAYGGLKMISCGLVPGLTSKASKLAAASAGAKVLRTFSYELSEAEVDEIERLVPDIVLLSGGIDGGNKDVIIQNAKTLAKTKGDFSVIVAGNKSASGTVAATLREAGKNVIVCENVMPEFNKLNTLPARAAIRDLFIQKIIHAKGLDKAQSMMTGEIIPTPLAVFEAAELLANGTKQAPGLGELMAFDVGGATTDVYSVATGSPTKANVVMKGLPEPFAKRTVEGDIGMRYSAASLIAEAGLNRVAELAGVSEADVLAWQSKCLENPGVLPDPGSLGSRIDEALAACAVSVSTDRHCGFFEVAYTPFGEVYMQTGKDLTGVKTVVATGGSVIHSKEPGKIVSMALAANGQPHILRPAKARMLLDQLYIFSAMGLLSRADPDAALAMMKESFVEINC